MPAHIPSQFEVETFSGRYVDTQNPRAECIVLDDIAHALSQICRYGGHCRTFYSVAEHAVCVSKRLERRGHSLALQLAGLHHDDAEAFLGDIPRPLKPLLGAAYVELNDRMDKAIAVALELPLYGVHIDNFHGVEVKDADNWMLFVEAKHFLPSGGINWSGSQLDGWGVRQDGLPSRIVTPDYFYGGLDSAEAKEQYLARHSELMGKLA